MQTDDEGGNEVLDFAKLQYIKSDDDETLEGDVEQRPIFSGDATPI